MAKRSVFYARSENGVDGRAELSPQLLGVARDEAVPRFTDELKELVEQRMRADGATGEIVWSETRHV